MIRVALQQIFPVYKALTALPTHKRFHFRQEVDSGTDRGKMTATQQGTEFLAG